MARIRTVKPDFFRSAKVARATRDARLLWIGMWTEADDHGRGLASAKHLAGTLFAHDPDVTDRRVERWLQELARTRLIHLYEVRGTRYYEIHDWGHQKINRPGPPRYPSPAPPTLFDLSDGSVNAHGGRTEPSSREVEVEVDQGRGSGARFTHTEEPKLSPGDGATRARAVIEQLAQKIALDREASP